MMQSKGLSESYLLCFVWFQWGLSEFVILRNSAKCREGALLAFECLCETLGRLFEPWVDILDLEYLYLLFFSSLQNWSVISQVCDPDVAVAISIFLWSSCRSSWSCWMCCSCNDVSTYCSGCEACLAFSFEGDNYFCCSRSAYLIYDILTCFCFSQNKWLYCLVSYALNRCLLFHFIICCCCSRIPSWYVWTLIWILRGLFLWIFSYIFVNWNVFVLPM